jgi:mRNA interferase MazF
MDSKNSDSPVALQGEIWLFDPDPIKGNEIGKKVRPCLIISNNRWNKTRSGLVIIVPLTSVDKGIATHIKILPPDGGVTILSFAMCEQVRTISKERLKKRLGKLVGYEVLETVRGWLFDLTRVE